MKKNFNINSLSGVDDMDVCQSLGLDSSVAYTPEINDAAIDLVYKRNLQATKNAMLKEGRSLFEAQDIALKDAEMGKKDALNLLKKVQKKRGY